MKSSNCSLKRDLDNPGCNALPLSPRVQSGGGRCLRRCPGLTQLVWTEVIWSYVVNLMILSSGLYQAALNAELAEIRRIQTSMAQVGKLYYVGNSSLNPKKWFYCTNYQFFVFRVLHIQCQKRITCIESFNCWFTDLSTTTTYREHFSWWDRYNSSDSMYFQVPISSDLMV